MKKPSCLRTLARRTLITLPVLMLVLLQAAPLAGQQIPIADRFQFTARPAAAVANTSWLSVPDAPVPADAINPAYPVPIAPAAFMSTAAPKSDETHRFWDPTNRILFVAVGGMAAADFVVTHQNLASGGKELNPLVRVLSGTTPGLAANFALGTGGIMGAAYWFHKTGHHKLERLTSIACIGTSSFAVAYGLSHR